MSKVFVFALLVASFVATVACSPIAELSDREGYCKIGDVYIKQGEKDAGPVGECYKFFCRDASKNAHMGIGCDLQFRPGCHNSQKDLTKRYPDCCPKLICDDKDSDE